MTPVKLRLLLMAAGAAAAFSSPTIAAPVAFTLNFPGGFNVSINGGQLTPSGPIMVRGIVDDATADINPNSAYGEFPLLHARFTGAGFVNQNVVTPLSLSVFFGSNFAFQRLGEFNQGIIGWNGTTSSGAFMADVNDLGTLGTLPYTTAGDSTFWYDALDSNLWLLESGDTIGGNIGAGGPPGVFSIERIPEPSALIGIATATVAGIAGRRRRRRFCGRNRDSGVGSRGRAVGRHAAGVEFG